MTDPDKLRWLINFWETSARRSQDIASRVSGEGEAAEIYRHTATALHELLDMYARHGVPKDCK